MSNKKNEEANAYHLIISLYRSKTNLYTKTTYSFHTLRKLIFNKFQSEFFWQEDTKNKPSQSSELIL